MKKPSYVIKKAQMLENKEILLPNGKTLGNRMYKSYYKQFIRDNFNRHQKALRKMVLQSLNIKASQ